MKAQWIIPVIIIAGAISFSAGRRCGGMPAADLSPLRDTSAIEKSLDLTAQQSEQVRALSKEFKERAESACDKHCEARCTIARKLFQENAAPVDVQKHVDAMCAAYAEQERATMDHLLKLRAILTPEQTKKLNEKLAACICEKCASTSGSCCHMEK
jgi:Spy/CpxP family protein refolding chaperone